MGCPRSTRRGDTSNSAGAGLRRMLDAARDNVIVGESVAGDRYSAERLGRHLKSLAKELSEEPEGPPFFGRLDFGGDSAEHRGRATTSAGGTSPASTAARRSSSTGGRPSRGRSTGPAPATRMGVEVRRRFGWAGTRTDLLRGRTARPRPGDREPDPGRRDRTAPRGPDARHRRHHPARAGRPGPCRARRSRSACRARPAPARRPSGCTGRRSCCTRTGSGWSARGCWCWAPTGPSSATSRRCCPRWARSTSSRPRWSGCSARSPVTATDSPAAALVKHDARMAEVLRQALYGRIGKPVEPVSVADGSYRWRVGADELRRIVDDTRREAMPYAIGRERVRARITDADAAPGRARGHTGNAVWTRRMTGQGAHARSWTRSGRPYARRSSCALC